MTFKSIEDLDLKGKSIFLRLDLNVPLKNGVIIDETRIQAALPTIRYIMDKGGKLVLASHLGRPKGEGDKNQFSLQPVAERLSQVLNVEVILVEEPSGEAPKALLGNLKPNQVIMLENLRFEPGETKNEKSLYDKWARYIDVYINDAFGASHRVHASIVGLPSQIKQRAMGFLIRKEVEMLNFVLKAQRHPYVAILGGAKVSDKISVIESLVDKVDTLIVGGAMAYTFLAAQNIKVGKSLVEKDKIHLAKEIIERFSVRNKQLLLPVDHVVVKAFDKPETLEITSGSEIPDETLAVDIGPKTIKIYEDCIARAELIFWNGPMGVFETPEYAKGTLAIARALASSSGLTIVGGGDSVAAMNLSGEADKISHISTGGGASLEYIQGDVLPGIEALKC